MVPATFRGPWNREVNGASRRGSFYHPIRPEIDAASRMAPSLWSERETGVETEKRGGQRPDISGDLQCLNSQSHPPHKPPSLPGRHVQPRTILWAVKAKQDAEDWAEVCPEVVSTLLSPWEEPEGEAALLHAGFHYPRSPHPGTDASCQQSGLSVISANERAAE